MLRQHFPSAYHGGHPSAQGCYAKRPTGPSRVPCLNNVVSAESGRDVTLSCAAQLLTYLESAPNKEAAGSTSGLSKIDGRCPAAADYAEGTSQDLC